MKKAVPAKYYFANNNKGKIKETSKSIWVKTATTTTKTKEENTISRNELRCERRKQK